MAPKNRNKRSLGYDPKWFQWIAVIGIVLIFIQNLSAPTPSNPDSPAIVEKVDTIKTKSIAELKEFKGKIFPDSVALRIKDTAVGSGAPVICGQEVTIAYTASVNNQPIADSASKDLPRVFRIGSHSAMPALEDGVVGMQEGGKREIYAPMSTAYGIKAFARSDITTTSPITFDIELLKVSPEIPDVSTLPYRIAIMRPGNGPAINCGTQATVKLTVWNSDGSKRFATEEPVHFITGNSEIILGIDQGVLGMHPGEKRSLFIPPSLQRTLRGTAATIAIPLPKHETILVDVEAVDSTPSLH